MAKIHHLFVIDPIESLNFALDSSLRLARALRNLGHEVAICTPAQMEWQSRTGCASASIRTLRFDQEDLSKYELGPFKHQRLDSFQAIHMRKDPPYDLAYISCTWLLSSAVAKGVRVFNAPSALRDLNEKISIFHFPEAIQNGVVGADADRLFTFLKESCDGDGVLKPLTLFGGRGVTRLNLRTSSEADIRRVLQDETSQGLDYRLLQPFDKRIFEGEVRVFTAGGQAISWCLKRPSADNFLANTRSGATLEAYEPSAVEVAQIEGIAQALMKDGVYFIGFDVIGGNISEINITSPRLLQAPGDSAIPYNRMALMLAETLA
jgi:glutathione synthase